MTMEDNSSYQDYGLLGWDAVWFGRWETNIVEKTRCLPRQDRRVTFRLEIAITATRTSKHLN